MSLRQRVKSTQLNPDPRTVPIPEVRGGSTDTHTELHVSSFSSGPFVKSQSILFGANLLGYILSIATSTHYHVDLLGTGAFALAALPGLLGNSTPLRVLWSSAAVVAWSVRLASFLFSRVIQKGGQDNRLDEILLDPYYAAGFWIYSWLWGALVSLPHTLGLSSTLPGNPFALKLGFIMFATGWIMETFADFQKWVFKLDHPGQFCNLGLWSISQHPNWCGDLLLWTGIWLINAPALVEPVKLADSGWWSAIWRYRRLILSCVGPFFLYNLFESEATGRLLKESYDAARQRYGYGVDPDYTQYVDTTPLIFPRLF